MPAVKSAGHVLQRCTRRYSGDPAVAGAVARADVDLAARGFDDLLSLYGNSFCYLNIATAANVPSA